MNQFEKLSPFSIAYNEKKIVFENNLFEDNIGFMGGAINIESPNMRNVTAISDVATNDAIIPELKKYLLTDMEIRPYVYIHNNVFNRNMAYLSGSSIFSRSTRMGDDLRRADELCGIIKISNNKFTDNLGATS
jgi:hypothetical protein